MPVLPKGIDLPLRAPLRGCADKVSPAVAEHDRMYVGDGAHYLRCGASALTVLHTASVLAGIRPTAILDFGSGAGRVTRWMRAFWPGARIAATDLRAEDLAFCAAEFGCATFPSSTDIAALAAPGRYDLIWAGSVLTHLDEARAEALVAKLLSWTKPDGVVVATLHGRHVEGRGAATRRYGLSEEGWAELLRGYRGEAGFGYADYPPTPGYGVSLTRPSWATGLAERLPGTRLVLFGERLWDAHQDVFALQRRAIDAGG